MIADRDDHIVSFDHPLGELVSHLLLHDRYPVRQEAIQYVRYCRGVMPGGVVLEIFATIRRDMDKPGGRVVVLCVALELDLENENCGLRVVLWVLGCHDVPKEDLIPQLPA